MDVTETPTCRNCGFPTWALDGYDFCYASGCQARSAELDLQAEAAASWESDDIPAAWDVYGCL